MCTGLTGAYTVLPTVAEDQLESTEYSVYAADATPPVQLDNTSSFRAHQRNDGHRLAQTKSASAVHRQYRNSPEGRYRLIRATSKHNDVKHDNGTHP